jgi:signal peptidase
MAAVEDLRPDLLAPLVRDLAAEGRPAEIPVRGNSMRPMLREGDRVRLAPLTHAEARLGDVVLRVAPSGPIIHRVVGWWPSRNGWRLLTKGDGARRLDPPLPPEELAGRVVARVRGGSVRQLDGAGMRVRGRGRALVSLMTGLVVEAWDRARGRTRSDAV